MSKINSGGILQQGITDTTDVVTRSVVGTTADGRTWNPVAGAWSANGNQLTTSTARTSDPKLMVTEPYSDFDMKVDVGYGDAVYFRYQDASNWLRVSHYMTYSTSSYYYTYHCGYQNCNCTYGCVANYTYTYLRRGRRECVQNTGTGYRYTECFQCGSCCTAPACPSGYTGGSDCFVYSTSANGCTLYAGDFCSQTCQTCDMYCGATGTNEYYDAYLRLEKYVAGALTVVQDLYLGSNARASWLRVVGNGTNIQVFSNRQAGVHINQTVNELRWGTGFGVGRTGFGNQDSGAILDNLTLKLIN